MEIPAQTDASIGLRQTQAKIQECTGEKSMSKTALVILIGAALLFSAPAFAIDGQILINQSTVLAAGGFPYKITQSGSYKLSGNLIVPNADTNGIVISADYVTLDLNGFSIAGPVTCTPFTFPVQCSTSGTGVGILSPNQGTTVLNGTVRGMGAVGIDLGNNSSLVQGIHADSNGSAGGAGLLVFSGIVTHCTAAVNAGSGIASVDAVVSFNDVRLNGGRGIQGGSIVNNNVAINNGEDGIINPALAVNNVLEGNIGFGLNMLGGNGYMGNVMNANSAGTVNGGKSLGQNLCNGASC